MAQSAPLAITVHDYMDLPEGPPFYELVEGELIMMPPPSLYHQGIAGNFARIILRYLEDNPICEFFCPVRSRFERGQHLHARPAFCVGGTPVDP